MIKVVMGEFNMDEKFVRNAKKLIILTILIVIVGVVIWWKVMQRMELKVDKYTFDESKITEQFEYNIDELICEEGQLSISGWLVKPDSEATMSVYTILLKNMQTQECYKIPTMRTDVSDEDVENILDIYGENTGVDICGFYAYTNYEELNLSQQDYEVYMLVKDKGKEYIVPFDTTVNEWSGDDEE